MKKTIITGFSLFLLLMGCSGSTEEIVARVGQKAIYYDDFIKSYNFEPVYRRGNTIEIARKKQLKQFTDKKLLAYGGKYNKVDTSFFYRERLAWYKKKTLVDAFFKTNIEDKITVSESELLKGFEKQRKTVHVKHLFFKDSIDAEEALANLKRHSSDFNNIASNAFTSETLKKSGGDLGYCRFGDLEEPIENAAFSLDPGTIYPKIVKSRFGFHIVKAEEIKINLLATESAFAENKPEIKRVIKSRKYSAMKNKIIRDIMADNPVSIRIPAFNSLLFYARRSIVKRDKENQPYIPNIFAGELEKISQNLNETLKDTLLHVGGKVWTTGSFLRELKRMPPLSRPAIDTEEGLYLALKYAALDDIISAEAVTQQLKKNDYYTRKLNNFEDNLLAGEFKNKLFKNVKPDTDEVNQYYLKKFGKIPQRESYIYNYTLNRFVTKKRDSLLAAVLDSIEIVHPISVNDSLLFRGVKDKNKVIDYNPTPVYRKKLY